MKTKPIIFYAEDDLDDQELFANVLHDIQFKAELYFQNNGEELLHAIKYHTTAPNFIFLDLNMPGKNGFCVLEELRSKKEYDHLPVVILSTSNDPAALQIAKSLHANLFLTKPADYNQLKALIRMVLSIDWNDTTESQYPFYMNISQTTIVKAS